MQEDTPNQTVNDLLCDGTILIGYGKKGHGMNGKDEDIGRVGQCLVRRLETVDPVHSKHLRVDIHLRLYASVCAPSGESFNFEALCENASPELREYFKGKDIDIDTLEQDIEADTPEAWSKLDKVVEYFRDQATMIACGADPCPEDPMAFMWNDDCWDGGTDITLSVPLTLDDYEAIETLVGHEQRLADHRKKIGAAVQADKPLLVIQLARDFAKELKVISTGKRKLGLLAERIYTEIHSGNKGGTPERDRMKRFEEEVGLWNDSINALECYARPKTRDA